MATHDPHTLPRDVDAGRVLCLHCKLLHDVDDVHCRRCGAHLHQRIPASLAKTWSLVIAGLLFLIPANLLPMMIVTKLGSDEAGTIMDGVIYFLHSGAYGIAFVIFTASVAVPVFKLSALLFMLLIVRFRLLKRAILGVRLYRIIRFVGKWSMLDIFVVALMVAFVQFQNLASIVPGPAAVAFALAVVMTMLATESFDPRLMFDTDNSLSRGLSAPPPSHS